tara:strand:+ start:21397 stop:22440 length:1044 start_codon:yes stop_codon:yes gene_type:complete
VSSLILSRHIFSRKKDLFAFSSWFFVGIFFFLFSHLTDYRFHNQKQLPWILIIIIKSLQEITHVYATFLISYADQEVFKKLKRILIMTPILIFLASFAFIIGGKENWFFILIAQTAIFHVIRQEYGWMKIATRLDSYHSKWLERLDLLTIYSITISPTLWLLRHSENGYWIRPGDSFLVPDILARFAMSFSLIVIILFWIINSFHWWKYRQVNLTKILVFFNGFFGWYIALYFITDPQYFLLSSWLLTFAHGVPYFFIVFKTERLGDSSLIQGKYFRLSRSAYLYGLLILFFFIFYAPFASIQKFYELPLFWKALLASAISCPNIVHCIIDGFLWRKSTGLSKRLFE